MIKPFVPLHKKLWKGITKMGFRGWGWVEDQFQIMVKGVTIYNFAKIMRSLYTKEEMVVSFYTRFTKIGD